MVRRIEQDTLIIEDEQGKLIMSLKESISDDVFSMAVAGDIKNEVAPEFEDELMTALTICSRIELDFSGVDYISGPGLRVLLSVQQMIDGEAGRVMVIKNVSAPAMKIFKETGFADLLYIEEAG